MIIYKYKGQSLLSYCKENKIPYGQVRNKLIEGVPMEEAIKYAIEHKGKKSAPRVMINGVGLITYIENNYKHPVKAFMAYNRLKFLGYSQEEILEYIERFK
jgi:hypothetical protein